MTHARVHARRAVDVAAFAPIRTPISEVVLHLPMPPSVNALWRPRKGGGVYLDPKYAGWKQDAGWELLAQRPGRIAGPYAIHLSLCRAETGADLDNLMKAVCDLLQAHGIIANDRLAETTSSDWLAPKGAVVTVREWVE